MGVKSRNNRGVGRLDVMSWLGGNARYILFLCVLAFLSIMNAHLAEQKIRKIAYLKKEVRELNWKYLTIRSEWMNNSSLSKLEESLEDNSIGKEGKKPVIIKSNP